jgi:chorismate dehydratase
MLRLGVVSFLNSRPLIEGLERAGDVQIVFDVPARLAARLLGGEVDASLVPLIDVVRAAGRLRVVSDACIASDGETMTVRVFSQVPPQQIRHLWVDADSHTSVALASVLWGDVYGLTPELCPLEGVSPWSRDFEAVLVIGDKVVDPGRRVYAYEVDLGGLWRQHTGLPFVFAVWATQGKHRPLAGNQDGGMAAALSGHVPPEPRETVSNILSAARDRGVQRATEIAETDGPRLGWSVDAARHYLTRCLRFKLDARTVAGANLFVQRCAELGLAPADARVPWPDTLCALAGAPA